MDDEIDEEKCLEIIPQVIFFLLLFGFTIYIIFDYQEVFFYFVAFTDWVAIHPYLACIAVTTYFILIIIVKGPALISTVAISFALVKAYEPQPLLAFVFGYPFIVIGHVLGGCIAFFISRYLFSNIIKRECYHRYVYFRAIDSTIADEGWKMVVTIRMTPISFSIISYFLGLTTVHFIEFLIGSFGCIVPLFMQFYLGYSLRKLNDF